MQPGSQAHSKPEVQTRAEVANVLAIKLAVRCCTFVVLAQQTQHARWVTHTRYPCDLQACTCAPGERPIILLDHFYVECSNHAACSELRRPQLDTRMSEP